MHEAPPSPAGQARDRSRRALCVTGLLALTLAAVSCFEDPVSERLELDFLPNGGVDIRQVTLLDLDAPVGRQPLLERRLSAAQRSLAEGWDPWTYRFQNLAPELESLRRDKRRGELYRVERTARLSDPQDLAGLFFDTSVAPVYERGETTASFAFYAGRSTRASRRERERVGAALDRWSATLSAYYTALAHLFRYLDAHPERATETIAAALNLDSEDLPSTERALVEAVTAPMSDTLDIGVIEPGETASLDELSQRVFDPFPAHVTVTVPGEPVEVEGFVRSGASSPPHSLTVPRLRLADAFLALEGRWAEPDLLGALVRDLRSTGDDDLDPVALASLPRQVHSLPDAEEVRQTLVTYLEPAPVYRVEWRQPRGRTSPPPP